MKIPDKTITVAAIYLGTFMATLAISIVTVALPAIQIDLETGMSGLQWVVGSYALCLSAFMLSAGPLGDRYGRKRIWLTGILLFMSGSVICGMASSLPVLILGCTIQGIAGSVVIPGALSILTQTFPDPAERAHIIGGWSSFSGISLITGPVLGGLLIDNFGWPSIFIINLPVGLSALLLGLHSITETADPDQAAFDPAGQILSILVLGSLTYSLISGGSTGWIQSPVIIASTVFCISLLTFIIVEKRTKRPVFPVDLFRKRSFATVNTASFILGFSGYTSLFLFSLFLQQAQNWSATQAGWRMAPVFAAMALVASQFGRLTKQYSETALMIAGYLLIGLSMLSMALFNATTPYWFVAPVFTLLGTGMGIAIPATGAATMKAVPRERTGSASSTMNAMRQSGMTIGIALLGAVMSNNAINKMRDDLHFAGISNPLSTATHAIQSHTVPDEITLPADMLTSLINSAIAHGFTYAALIAGIAATFMAVLMALVRHKP